MVGNLLPDFTKQITPLHYNPEIMTGVALHRFIDSYTDAHPIVKISKRRISDKRRRFSGIMIDIFYDHFLAIHWQQHNIQSLRESTRFYYQQLSQANVVLPQRLEVSISRMPEIDLLYNYRTLNGIEHAINRVSQRIRFKNELEGGMEELQKEFTALENDFVLFFNDLKQAVNDYKSPSLDSLSHTS